MLVQCWASVVDGGPTLGRCLVSAGTSMLFSIQPMTGGQERGGLWGGGTCMCTFCVHCTPAIYAHTSLTRTLWSLNQHSMTPEVWHWRQEYWLIYQLDNSRMWPITCWSAQNSSGRVAGISGIVGNPATSATNLSIPHLPLISKSHPWHQFHNPTPATNFSIPHLPLISQSHNCHRFLNPTPAPDFSILHLPPISQSHLGH